MSYIRETCSAEITRSPNGCALCCWLCIKVVLDSSEEDKNYYFFPLQSRISRFRSVHWGDELYECRDWVLSFLLLCLLKWSFLLKALYNLSIFFPNPSPSQAFENGATVLISLITGDLWLRFAKGTSSEACHALRKWLRPHLRAARRVDGRPGSGGVPALALSHSVSDMTMSP